jgi:hypothetical protein
LGTIADKSGLGKEKNPLLLPGIERGFNLSAVAWSLHALSYPGACSNIVAGK